MRLNIDVTTLVMSLLPRDDCSRMLRTCKTMYSLGIVYLFSDYTWSHESTSGSLDKFLRFLLLDPEARIPLLRSLRLLRSVDENGNIVGFDQDRILPSAFHSLSAILDKALNLERLELLSNESFIRIYAIYRAISYSCLALKSIKFSFAGEVTMSLIPNLQQALVNLTLQASSATIPLVHLPI
jgi:hypothetical protein